MRLIYTDEAGTSANEPVSVVTSIIVNGDSEYRLLCDEIAKLIEKYVPDDLKNGFIFHAKDIFNGSKPIDRKAWPLEDRLDFLKEMVCLPRIFDIPIAAGMVWRAAPEDQIRISEKIPPHFLDHAFAFSQCLERADFFLRHYLEGAEHGVVIAEDVLERRKHLTVSGLMFRDSPMTLPSEELRSGRWHSALGVAPEGVTYKITHIIDVPHFVDKKNAPLLQLADARAFSLRRGLCKQSGGRDLVLAMWGGYGDIFLNDPVWFSLMSSGLFNTEKYWSAEQVAEQASQRHAFRDLAKPVVSSGDIQ